MIDITKLKPGEFFEITMLSIGGLGAYTIGQMLGLEISKINNVKTSIFASYSSEKKGAPVNVYIRCAVQDTPIRNFSAVKNPNMLVAFKEELLTDENLINLKADGILLINTSKTIEQLQAKYNLTCKNIFLVDADKIAKTFDVKINNIIFGAIHKVLSCLEPECSQKTIYNKLIDRYAHLVTANIDAFYQGYNDCQYFEINPTHINNIKHIELGIEDQLDGGYILGANSFLVDRSISREGYMPLFNKELCINCTKCDLTCPDDCFIWEEVEGRRGRLEMQLQGIDYQYCKGCMRCVTACPTGSLSKIEENEEIKGIKKGYQLMED